MRPDADMAHAVENLVDGAFFNSGQCCCGIERIYVHESRYDTFVDGAVDLVGHYVLGNPLDEATTLGPMAHRRFADLVGARSRRRSRRARGRMSTPSAFPPTQATAPISRRRS